MSTKCRVWWPKELASSEFSLESASSSSSASLLLFGWFISCSPACLDVVVAFAYDEAFLCHHSSQSAIVEATSHTHGEMPITLQDKCRFTVLGCLLALEHTEHIDKHDMAFSQNKKKCSLGNCGKWTSSLHSSTWIQLMYHSQCYSANGICWVPSLHHLHWNGKLSSQAELHVCYSL